MSEKTEKGGEYYRQTPTQKVEYVSTVWWNAGVAGKEAHTFLIGHITSLRNKQSTRYENFRKLNAIYEWGFKTGSLDTTEEQPLAEYTNAYNAAANVVDTVHAKVFKNSLVPMPITKGGGALQRQRAKNLGKALDGVYDENDVDRIEEDVGFDALICGAGFAKTYTEFGRVRVGFVPCDDMTQDDAEGRYRSPRCIYETKRMDRFQALEIYGADRPKKDEDEEGADDPEANDDFWLHGDAAERRKRIMECKQAPANNGEATSNDQIEVHEAYHLPSGPGAGDGRMSVCIDNCTLVDVEWKRPRFPYHKMIPKPRRRGAWGLSLMHDLAANQHEYEVITKKIQDANRTMGGTHILGHVDCELSERDIDNAQGTFIEWSGSREPHEFNPTPVNPQTYQYQSSIPQAMLTSKGISQMSASGQIPAGLTQASGKALQVYDDIEAEGLRPYHSARGQFHKSLSQGIIDEERDLCERNESYTVRYCDKGVGEDVDWKKVMLDEEEYVLTIPSINALSTSPSARYAQLESRFNAGTITADQFKRLDEMPDMQSENEMDTADTDIILRNLDIMVTEGRYMAPQPFDNLDLCVQLGGKFYNICRQREESPEALKMIQDYIAAAADLKTQGRPKAPAPPMMDPGMPPPGGPPPGMPMDPSMMPPPGMPPGPPMPPDMGGAMPPPMAA